MKLTDLDASFVITVKQDGETLLRHQTDIAGAQGLMFLDPLKQSTTILVWFSNPQGAEPALPEFKPQPRWEMSGTGLHDLTLTPSINVQGVWHGFVTNGEAR